MKELFEFNTPDLTSSLGRTPILSSTNYQNNFVYFPAKIKENNFTEYDNQWNKWSKRGTIGVFPPTSNLVKNPEDLTTADWTNGGTTDAIQDTYWNGLRFTRITSDGVDSSRNVAQTIGVINSTVASIQVVMKRVDSQQSAISLYKNTVTSAHMALIRVTWATKVIDIASGAGTIISNWYGDNLVEIKVAVTGLTSGHSYSVICYPTYNVAEIRSCDYTAIMVDSLQFPTPYTKEARVKGDLSYPFIWPKIGSIECWVRPWFGYDTTSYPSIFDNRTRSATNNGKIFLEYFAGTDQWRFGIQASSSSDYCFVYGDTQTNNTQLFKWSHFKCYWNINTEELRLWIDGTECASRVGAGSIAGWISSGDVLNIGINKWDAAPTNWLVGQITDFCFSDSNETITSHYEAELPFGDSLNDGGDTNVYYAFDTVPASSELFSLRGDSFCISDLGLVPTTRNVTFFPEILKTERKFYYSYDNKYSAQAYNLFPETSTIGFFKATTNLIKDPEDLSSTIWLNDTGNSSTPSEYFFQGKRFHLITQTVANTGKYQNVTFTGNGVKAVSVILKKSSAVTDSRFTLYDTIGAVSKCRIDINWSTMTAAVSTYGILVKQNWYGADIVELFMVTDTITAANLHTFKIHASVATTSATIYATAAQAEDNSYPTPYTSTSRTVGQLIYNKTWPSAGTLEFWTKPWFRILQGTDLVLDGDFELNNLATRWSTAVGTTTGTSVIARSSEQYNVLRGTYAMKLVSTGATMGRAQNITVVASTVYTLSAWIKVTAFTAGRVSVDAYAAGLDTSIIVANSVSNGWVLYQESFTVPVAITTIAIRIFCDNTPTLTAYVDDVRVILGTPPRTSRSCLITDRSVANAPYTELCFDYLQRRFFFYYWTSNTDELWLWSDELASNDYLTIWHHLKVVWDATNDVYKLYHNGVERDSQTTAVTFSPRSSLCIGSMPVALGTHDSDAQITDLLIRSVGDSSNTHYTKLLPYYNQLGDSKNFSYYYKDPPVEAEVFSLRNEKGISSLNRKPIPNIVEFPGTLIGDSVYYNQSNKWLGYGTIGVFKATTNYCSDPEDWTFNVQKEASVVAALTNNYFNHIRSTKITYTNTNGYVYKHFASNGALAGRIFSMTVYIWSEEIYSTFIYLTDATAWSKGHIDKITLVKGLNEYKYTFTFPAGSGTTYIDFGFSNFDFSAGGSYGSGVGAAASGAGNYRIVETLFEESVYPTPYTPTSRIAGNIIYNRAWAQVGTIEAWVRPHFDYTGALYPAIIRSGSGTPRIVLAYGQAAKYFYLTVSDGSTTVSLAAGCNGSGVWSNANVFANNTYLHTWIHFKVLWDTVNDKYKLYVNGTLIDSSTTALTSITFAEQLTCIGVAADFTGQFDGQIADLCIWDKGDSSSTHYSSGLPYYDPLNDTFTDPGWDAIPSGAELFSFRNPDCISSTSRQPMMFEYFAPYLQDQDGNKYDNQWHKFKGKPSVGTFSSSTNLVLEPENQTVGANWANDGSGDSLTAHYWNNKVFTKLYGLNTLPYVRVTQAITVAAAVHSVTATFKKGFSSTSGDSTYFSLELYVGGSPYLAVSILWNKQYVAGTGTVTSCKWYGDVCEITAVSNTTTAGTATLYVSGIRKANGTIAGTNYGFVTGVQVEQKAFPTPYLILPSKSRNAYQALRYNYEWPTAGVIECWARGWGERATTEVVVDSGPWINSGHSRLLLRYYASTFSWYVILAKNASDYIQHYVADIGSNLEMRQWVHLKVIYDLSRPYVNLLVNNKCGTTYTKIGAPTNLQPIYPQLFIGADYNYASQFNGIISDLTVYPLLNTDNLAHKNKNRPFYSNKRWLGEDSKWRIP